MKRNMIKKLSVLLLAVMLVLPMLGGLEVYAAAKTSLDAKKLTIGIGSYSYVEYEPAFSKTSGRYRINVVNSKKGASYIFTSSNKKVATVKGEKTTGYITGVKAGTATITVQQKLKGKLTKVGSCKVTVKRATVKATGETPSVGTGKWSYIEELGSICEIKNINPKATYTFKSNSKNFKMSQKMVPLPVLGDDFEMIEQTYTAKKAGTYTVTVKETYKRKTKTIGKIKVKVVDNSLLKNEVDLPVGRELYLKELLKYNYNYAWMVECDEEDILEPGEPLEDGSPTVRGIKPGTAKLKFKYDFGDGKAGAQFGVCTVTVKELKVTDIELEDETVNASQDDIGEELNIYYSTICDPEGYYYDEEDVIFTSSDEKVVSINSDGKCIVEGLGSATVTITAGDVSKTVTVNVLAEDESDDYDDYDDF